MFCGVSKADFLEKEAKALDKWLKNGNHGKMSYMENHFDKRLDPTKLVEGSKSVISLLLNYYPQEEQTENSFKLSKYAYGTDYHFVIKDKLKQLLHFIQDEIGDVHGRAFVDSAPVLDKAWAAKRAKRCLGVLFILGVLVPYDGVQGLMEAGTDAAINFSPTSLAPTPQTVVWGLLLLLI